MGGRPAPARPPAENATKDAHTRSRRPLASSSHGGPSHVHAAPRTSERGVEDVWPHVEDRAHQQAAGGAALDGQRLRAGVALLRELRGQGGAGVGVGHPCETHGGTQPQALVNPHPCFYPAQTGPQTSPPPQDPGAPRPAPPWLPQQWNPHLDEVLRAGDEVGEGVLLLEVLAVLRGGGLRGRERC